jgi:histidine triad (HIT) family protein
VAGQIPAERVYEDENFLAFLDIHPQAPGHVQLIPKNHYRWVWDVPAEAGYFAAAQKIARALQQTFGTPAVWSRVMGDEVAHAHLWLFPNPQEAVGDKNDFKTNGAKLRAALN